MTVTGREFVCLEDQFEIHLYKKRDITLVRGEGMYLFDATGESYLDMMSNYGVAILGHSHPAIHAAIVKQAGTLISCHQSFYNDARAEFIAALQPLLPDRSWRISFSNSGAEAVEAALKYARAATGRQRFVANKRAYHGRSLGALSVTGEQKHRTPFAPLLECTHVPFGDLDAVEGCLAGAAAIIVEPIQGESGVRPVSDAYLRGLRALCDESGALFICDEVQTAFRTGKTWCFEHSGIIPDIFVLSKPLANGLPIGVTVVSEAVAGSLPSGSHGSTFGGNPVVCAAAAATLTAVGEPGFNEHVADMGELLQSRLRAIHHPMIREVRGRGLMVATELKRNISSVLHSLQQRGVLAIPAGSTTIRFLPPLIIEQEHVHAAVDTLEQVLKELGTMAAE